MCLGARKWPLPPGTKTQPQIGVNCLFFISVCPPQLSGEDYIGNKGLRGPISLDPSTESCGVLGRNHMELSGDRQNEVKQSES